MLTTGIMSENSRDGSAHGAERFSPGAGQPIVCLLLRYTQLRRLSRTFSILFPPRQLSRNAGRHRISECSLPVLTVPFLASVLNVETTSLNSVLKGSLIVAMMALAGCSTPAAKDFGGKWRPVNQFRQQPTEIPLTTAYTFYAAPLDETLKTMLTRWANDSGRELSYKLSFDVTLYTPVSDIHTTNLDSAAQQLTTIYAAQGVYVSATDRKILVRPSQSTVGAFNSQAAPAASVAVAASATPVSSK